MEFQLRRLNEGGNATSASEHLSLLGNLTAIDDMHGVLSILIIVSVVLVLEHIFAILIETTADTPFEEMIHAIQSEMMIGETYLHISSYISHLTMLIVGAMAYGFKLILSGGVHIEEEWLFALEYAG